MTGEERRQQALRAIRVARGAIIATAAKWQASGQVDTSPLVAPLTSIQEAVAALEAYDARRVRPRSRAGGGNATRRHPGVSPERIPGAIIPRPERASRPPRHDGNAPRVGNPPPTAEERPGGEPRLAGEPRQSGELRREFSGLRVSTAAMEGETDPQRILCWVALLEHSADRCLAVLDGLEALDATDTSAPAVTSDHS